jgi:hypothetical protein
MSTCSLGADTVISAATHVDLGFSDPLVTQKRERVDSPLLESDIELATALWVLFGEKEFSAKQIKSNGGSDAYFLLAGPKRDWDAQKVGYRLRPRADAHYVPDMPIARASGHRGVATLARRQSPSSGSAFRLRLEERSALLQRHRLPSTYRSSAGKILCRIACRLQTGWRGLAPG